MIEPLERRTASRTLGITQRCRKYFLLAQLEMINILVPDVNVLK